MIFEEKQVSKLGNSRVIKLPKLKNGDEVFILDKEMLEFIRGTNNIVVNNK